VRLNDVEGVRVDEYVDATDRVLDCVAGEGDTVRVAVPDFDAVAVRDGDRDGVQDGVRDGDDGGDGDGDDGAMQPGGNAAAAAVVQLLSGTPTATTPDAVAMVEQPRRSTGSTRVAPTTAPAASATNKTPSGVMAMTVAFPRPVASAAAPGVSGPAVPLPITNSMVLPSGEMRMTVCNAASSTSVPSVAWQARLIGDQASAEYSCTGAAVPPGATRNTLPAPGSATNSVPSPGATARAAGEAYTRGAPPPGEPGSGYRPPSGRTALTRAASPM